MWFVRLRAVRFRLVGRLVDMRTSWGASDVLQFLAAIILLMDCDGKSGKR